jgi:inner membrane protein
MIFFGHLGITTGIVKGYEYVTGKKLHRQSIDIDYRFVFLGAILPDVIDKPIGMFLFRNTFHNSRLFAHTLIFSLILIFAGWLFLKRKRNNRILTLGICSLIHLLLDSMWLYPQTLFWPFISLTFPARPNGDWIAEDMQHLLSDPFYMGAEIVGFVIAFYLLIRSIHKKQFRQFILRGKL